jgi:hypothetical protein
MTFGPSVYVMKRFFLFVSRQFLHLKERQEPTRVEPTGHSITDKKNQSFTKIPVGAATEPARQNQSAE